jgi:predicted DNA binding protein
VLTRAQREALGLAFDRGYFDVPRDGSLDEMATNLDISPQALSDRLRRGQRNLLEVALVEFD